MKIDFFCGPSLEPFSPKSIQEGRGGSEEMVIYLASELAKTNQVTVWNYCLGDEGIYQRVTYKHYDSCNITETDALVVWRSPHLLTQYSLEHIKGKKYLWLHDLNLRFDFIASFLPFDHIFVLSEWHYRVYLQLCPSILHKRFIVTRNAVISPITQELLITRNPLTIVYGSLYNRGLRELLTLWPEIKAIVPQANLRVFYGWQTLEKLMPMDELRDFRAHIERGLSQEGITHLGRISHVAVIQEMLGAGIWAYPCLTFNEVSCITAMKAQVCGAIPIVIARAALEETVKFGIKIPWERLSSALLAKFRFALLGMLLNHEKQDAIRKKMMRESPALFSFEGLAKQWNDLFLREH